MIFDPSVKKTKDRRRPNETLHSFIGRVDDDDTDVARQRIERLFDAYPDNKKRPIKERLLSTDHQFEGACFELYLYNLLHDWGFTEVQVEPEIDGSKLSPDFFALLNGNKLYIEACVVAEHSDGHEANTRQIETVVSWVREISSPVYLLQLATSGHLPSLPKKSEICSRITAWIQALPSEGVFAGFPSFTFSSGTFLLELKPIMRKNSHYPESIGLEFPEGGCRVPGKEIRASILNKAKKYRNLDAPILIAVNALGFLGSDSDYLAALFGSEVFSVSFDRETGEEHGTSLSRKDDGALFGRKPRYTGVSGILAFSQASPWNWGTCAATLFHNPNAKLELWSFPLPIRTFKPNRRTGKFDVVEMQPRPEPSNEALSSES